MATRIGRWRRDIYNVMVTKIPSRQIRHFVVRGMLSECPKSFFIGLGTRFLDPWNVYLEDRVVINGDCWIDARGGDVKIGHDTDVGQQTNIWTLQHDPNSETHGVSSAPVTIGDHVWIASRVTILPGVTIGRGAVVAAGSIVTKDVAERTIVAGVPAKPIGQRENSLTYTLNYRPRFR